MLLQRVRVAESRMKHRLSNGPLRAQSKASRRDLVFCDVRQTLYAEDMIVSYKCTAQAVNQGGTADKYLFVLDRESLFCQGRFCL